MERMKGLLVALMLVTLTACFGEGEKETENPLVPKVMGLSQTQLVVGQTVYVAGENFLDEEVGRTELVFKGVYLRDDGKAEDAEFVVAPLFDGEFVEPGQVGKLPVEEGTTLLRWSRFGPYAIPFTAEGNHTGVFKGTLVARNLLNDGTSVFESDPTDITIEVQPSIIIRRLEPFVGFQDNGEPIYADCGAPALRALHKLPYILEVEAVGFQPAYFNYEFLGINGKSKEAVKYSQATNGATVDLIGDPDSGKLIVFNEVPENEAFYWGSIRVTAPIEGTDGDFVETALPLSVHRPMEFHMAHAKARPAQYYEPVAVSGCIPGSLNNQVTYQETKSEARQNAVSVSLSKSWTQSHSTEQSQNWSEGISETQSVSNTTGENWSHSESETLAESYGYSMNHSDSQSANYSSTDGESWGWSYNEGTSNQEMQAQMGEVYGEVSGSISTEVSAEGSVPGFAKVGGKVGTTVGASVGGKTGQTKGQTVGTSSNSGSNMSGSKSTSEAYGSTTSDSVGESVNQSYALASQEQIGGSTSQTEANSSSKVYTLGGSGGVSDALSVGEQETWQETWVATQTDSTLMSYSGKIPMGRHGVWYRQTVRYVRDAQVYSFNLCGVRELMGNLTFNEWAWSPALAVGSECGGSVMPEPDLPRAECVRPPCD
jgi:hypothetical protein